MPLTLSVDHLLALTLIVFACVGVVGLVGLAAGQIYAHMGNYWFFFHRHSDVEARHCRYCYLGRAALREESARVEGDDLVEVKCFVCCSCGLPQWTVQRSPVLKPAA